MSTQEHYQAKLETITAIEKDRIKKPYNIPISVYIHEAEFLLKWCRHDKAELVSTGMSWELVTDLPARIGALREAESIWGAERFQKKEAEKQWDQQFPIAYRLRNDLLSQLRFAYRKKTGLTNALKTVWSNNRKSGMIQDLKTLAHLGKNNPEPLALVKFDMTLLDRAEDMVKELAHLYAAATLDRNMSARSKQIRDQAYTHLKEAVDTIRNHGRYISRRNRERMMGYRSEFLKRKKRSDSPSAAKTAKNEPEEPPEIPSVS